MTAKMVAPLRAVNAYRRVFMHGRHAYVQAPLQAARRSSQSRIL